ncbi:MAG: hypothetical protein JNJ89_18655 [Rubrivivax sp.]|nr:hypothetical protein [Rubrivivax sp.]
MRRQPAIPPRRAPGPGTARLAHAAVAAVFAVAAAGAPAWAGGERASATPARSAGGKPQSGVSVTSVVPAKIAVGETVTVRLQVGGVTEADGATVEVRDSATRAVLLSARLAQGEQRTFELPYTGRSDGMQFISIVTSQGGRSTVKSVPMPVGSGALKLKPQGERRTTADGEAVISLPAASPASR